MNLVNLEKYSENEAPLRILGEISYFSFELLNLEDDLDVNENELVFYTIDSSKKVTYFSKYINCDINLNTFFKKKKPTFTEPLVINTAFSYSEPKQLCNFTTPAVTFSPLHCDYKDLIKLNLSIDTLLFVPNNISLLEISQLAIMKINEQIINFKRSYSFLNHDLKLDKIKKLIALNYQLENNQILTMILPDVEITKEEMWRKEISNEFKYERTLQRCQSLYPPNDVINRMTKNGDKLINPHMKINKTFSDCHTVKGRYTYYHYMQDNINDKGWGCAYRSLQTIVSWFVWQGWSKIDIPSHKDIQMSLVKIGDKDKSFINSHSWIGSFEINLVLQDILKIECRIISLTKGSDLANIYNELQMHFDDCGAPVMIGGGQLAHTIIGISKDESSRIRFLILDPHYTGLSNDLTTILGKGWCAWKELSFWKDNLPYNLCLPICPR